jgi:hypothetical protein
VRIVNVSNLAAYGVEIASDGGITQIVNARGSHELRLGMKPAGSSRWMSTRIDNPERFGFHGPCRNIGELRRIAEHFIAAAQDGELVRS